MDVGTVMQQVADRLDTITDLRVHAHPMKKVTAPAAMVAYPSTYDYDGTYGRGMDTMTLNVVVWVGGLDDRSVRDKISTYLAGSGSASVKAVLEAEPTEAHWWVSGPLDLASYTAPDYTDIPVDRLAPGDRFVYPGSHDKFTWDGATWNYDGTAGADGTAGQVIVIPAPTTYTAFDVLRVASADLDVYTMNATDYLVAVFELEISGQGA